MVDVKKKKMDGGGNLDEFYKELLGNKMPKSTN